VTWFILFGVLLTEDSVKAYIQGQEEHHRQSNFKEEFMALLNKHGIPYEERYLWV
jgi:hypothetical protein